MSAGGGLPGCPLCEGAGGRLLAQTPQLRLVHAGEAGYPAFYRLVWNRHVAELSDLQPAERQLCIDAVVAVEQVLRRHLAPAKINLASLGNMVPHLHWHVIARFDWDDRFPAPVWAPAARPPDAQRLRQLEAALPAVERELRDAVSAFG